MGFLKKLLVAGLLPVLLLGETLAHAADLPGEQFVFSNLPTNDRYTGINLSDDQRTRNTFSSLEAFTGEGKSRDSRMLTRTTCKSIGAQGCGNDKYFQYNAQLGMCSGSTSTDCVTKVFAKDPTGNEIIGKLVGTFLG